MPTPAPYPSYIGVLYGWISVGSTRYMFAYHNGHYLPTHPIPATVQNNIAAWVSTNNLRTPGNNVYDDYLSNNISGKSVLATPVIPGTTISPIAGTDTSGNPESVGNIIPNAVGAAAAATPSMLSWLSSQKFWTQAVEILIGVVLLGIGVEKVTKVNPTRIASKALL